MSMRSVGNLDLTVGLVNIPVQLFGVSDSHDRRAKQFHLHDDGSYGSVKMPKTCADCGAVLTPADIAKGFEEAGDVVILTSDDMETVSVNAGTAIEVPRFVKAAQFNPLMFAGENAYRLVPDPKRGRQALATYLTLRQSLIDQGLVGVVEYTRWGRSRVGLLCVEDTEYGGVLVLRNMMWSDELREPAFDILVNADMSIVDPRLAPVMKSVVESMTEVWDPADYVDTYTESLNAAIEAKAAGNDVAVVTDGAGAAAVDDVADLLAMLEASAIRKRTPEPEVPAAPAAKSRKRKAA